MSGKLAGIRSINTSPVDNPFCIKMSKNPNTICSKCYSIRMIESGYRKNCLPAWRRMGEILSSDLLDVSEIRPCKTDLIRFSSHGELINLTHLENLIQIAKVNSQSVCCLFTKRKDILSQLKQDIPANMLIVYSNPIIDHPLYTADIPEKADKVFNVFTKKYAEENKIDINCGKKRCKDCLYCYTHRFTPNVINELIK
jgi:hypothetical protein